MTPEAPTLEAAFQGKAPRETISITRRDLRRVYDLLNYGTSDEVDFVSLGCPHYNLEQLRRVAGLLEGKKCKVRLWVMTTPGAYPLAEMAGYRAKIEEAGGLLLSGACPGIVRGRVMPGDEYPNVVALDAAKQNYYLTGHCHPHKVQVRYGTMEECVDAAVTGKWRGEWR
jgi:predicted aconitase